MKLNIKYKVILIYFNLLEQIRTTSWNDKGSHLKRYMTLSETVYADRCAGFAPKGQDLAPKDATNSLLQTCRISDREKKGL